MRMMRACVQCGATFTTRLCDIAKGYGKYCGRSCSHEGRVQHGAARHDHRTTTEYRIWTGIKTRCLNTADHNYQRYGAQGIAICDRWANSFAAFLADVGPRPSLDHSIDRIDGKGNYEPGNCRWATRDEQGRNRRNNTLLTANGETRCLAEWAEVTGVGRSTIMRRLKLGWSVERAVLAPLRGNRS